jgi:UDP-galactopyranose mutase
MRRSILVIGAGFAGAVHARELADRGYEVHVLDRRPHIAGNAFDEIAASGVRVHRYGPHLFHTNNKTVVDWLARFGTFVDYQHRVQALLGDGTLVPLPVNRLTVNAVFGTDLRDAAQVEDFLKGRCVASGPPANAAEYLAAHIGPELTDLFFRPYTRKMWGWDLETMDAAVVRRIPIRFDDEDRYFPNDRFQIMPAAGYAALFENILDHPAIHVQLNQPFHHSFLAGHAHCFNSMPIDEFYDERFGRLPYRSIRFHHREVPSETQLGSAATINFTDDGIFTRQTDWSRLPHHVVTPGPTKTITSEEPCDDADNHFERYYPVKTSDGRFDAAYRRYKQLADACGTMSFIGRCGTYQYLDMHQVINQSLQGVHAWLARD